MIREFLILSVLIASQAFANSATESSLPNHLSSLLRASLTEKIAGSEIKLPSLAKLLKQKPMANFQEILGAKLLEDRPSGIALFEISGMDAESRPLSETIQTPFEAWKKVPVAVHRIYPNAMLKSEDFRLQLVNVAKSPAREYRGVMASSETNFTGQQSKQTILEGAYVVDSAIQKQPDIRKGDLVKLELISGDLTLTTQAVTEESGSIGGQIRVMTSKTKREIIGKIRDDRSVEVRL